MTVEIACIVEGQGDEEALPILIHRIGASLNPPVFDLVIPRPIRIPKSRLKRADELERAAEFAARRIAGRGGILVLIDSDEDCPAQQAPELLSRIRAARANLPIAVVMAKCEFEAWFLAGAESLRGLRGLPADLLPPRDPESIRGAKEWLSDKMPHGRSYRETLDQAALAASVSIEMVLLRSRSFRKLRKDIIRLCSDVRRQQQR